MENKINILLTGAGSPGGPGIIKAILKDSSNFKLYICDADINASGKYLLKERFRLIPKASDPKFIDTLLNICKKDNINLVVPLVTLELLKLSEAFFLFKKNNIQLLVSSHESLTTLNDKGSLYSHLNNKNVEIPKFQLVNNKQEFINGIYKLGYPKLPVVMKPRLSNGSRGVRVISEDYDEYDFLFNKKPSSLFTKLENILPIIENRTFPPLLLTEYLPGEELTVDCILKENILKKIIIRKRDQMRAGISTKGKFIQDQDIYDYTSQILSTFNGLDGPIGFQFKRSYNNNFLLLESNPRLQGSTVTAEGIGLNIPLIVIKNKLDMQVNIKQTFKSIGFSRYYENIFYEY